MSPTTHVAGYDILNEFFKEAAIGPGPMSDVEGLGKRPAFAAESTHRSEVLGHIVRSNTPTAQYSLGNDINAVSSTSLDILDPDLPIANAAISESSSTGSSEAGSSSTNPTSCTPSETNIHSDFPSGVQHTAYIKRSILDSPTS